MAGRRFHLMTRLSAFCLVVTATACSGGDGDGNGEQSLGAGVPSTTTEVPASTTVLEETTETAAVPAPAPAASQPATTVRSGAAGRPSRPSETSAPPTTQNQTTEAPQTTETTPAAAQLAIRNFTFSPPAMTIKVGRAVTATNFDSAPHTWSSDDGTWDSRSLAQNASYTHTFPMPGSFTYHCKIHPSMKGTIVVEN